VERYVAAGTLQLSTGSVCTAVAGDVVADVVGSSGAWPIGGASTRRVETWVERGSECVRCS